MMSPMSWLVPPPSILEMMKVEIAGTNTMVMPVLTPGRLSGATTRAITWKVLPPRSCAASITSLPILHMVVYSGRIINGM